MGQRGPAAGAIVIVARPSEGEHPEPEELTAMTHAIRDEADFTFLLYGTLEAQAIGHWAHAVFLPPEIFAELLKTLVAEWIGAGSAAAADAEGVALAAYRGEEAAARLRMPEAVAS